MRRILLLATLLSFGFAPLSWAQVKKAVTGTVKDAHGTLLPGVTVKEKGTSNGSMTTADGSFKISVQPSATLVFSFMGYVTQEVPAGDGPLNIVLNDDSKNLNEVVVTALGIKREARKLGYAMTELKGSEIAKTNAINPVAALQGKVAGVDISGAAGGPQAANRIVLRGAKSLDGKDQPIFVIDGVIFENEISDNAVNFGNVLKNFNPDEFESVSVLKGAAATALYGSRALNGAILITTKKGFTRKGLGVEVSQTVQFEKVYRGPIALQNVYGAGLNPWFNKDAQGNNVVQAGGTSFGPRMEGQMAKLVNGDIVPFSPMPDNAVDGYQLGKYYNTNVAVEGGNEKANFRFSYSRLSNNSVMPNNDFNRNSFSLKTSAVLNKFLSAEGGVTYAFSNTLNPTRQGGDYTNQNIGRKWIYIFPRNYDPAYWSARYLGPNPGLSNMDEYLGQYPGADYWFSLKHDKWERKENLFMGNLSLTATATDWLKLLLRGTFSNEQNKDDRRELGWGPNFGGSRGLYSISGNNRTQYTFTGMAMFTPKLNDDFSLSVNVGAETWRSRIGNEYGAATSGGLLIPGKFTISNSVGTVNARNNKVMVPKVINSVFAAASFSYKNAWFLDLTGRNDWASSLTYPAGTGTNSYFYPSVSAAWEFTETYKQSMPSWVTYGKVRASYARVGGDIDPAQLNVGYVMNEQWFGGVNPVYLYSDFNQDTYPNNNLKPSMSGSYEVGADLRFFNSRLGLDVAYYQADIKNQVLQPEVASESGVKKRYINAGHFRNRGIEIAINGTPVKGKNFTWDVNLNGTRNTNKILALYPGVDTYEMGNDQDVRVIAKVGDAYGTLVTNYGYTRYVSSDPAKNGLPIIEKSGSFPVQFKRGPAVVGNITPDFNLGLNNNFSYKNWSLGVLLQARIGGDIFSASHQYGTGRGTVESTLPGRDAATGGLAWVDNGVQRNDGMIPEGVFGAGMKGNTATGLSQDISGMTYREAYDKGYVNPLSPYQYYSMIGDWGVGIREASVFDASYVALREVSLGYTFPTKMVERWKLNKARVLLVGRNLGYLFNNLPDHINPESLRNNSTSAFSEYGGAPFVRNMALTIQLGF
ncbi:SusC/RagA family TonB-linked outer membrane protein [Chitinophaga lutea]|uniref:SusC/RagA family TonB-linked outer membrane protein n=1 Tax=Chitinophaga lutea TaxID=2488634 RepID=A0A3N4PWI3_9BACT|nr:SusC/RagA family TonB-linked outer membrane protein [Chitinophaga lutea]RPE09451.1 SusC/RagA family TonB-linked outer membrane protein [Chitinophaga lutea]